jgi:hypothetical protein
MAAARRRPLPDMTPLLALVAALLVPFNRMVAWDEPWDVEDDDD